MLLVTFTKNWWKSLTKSDDNQEKEISELTNTEFMTDKEKTADDLLATEEPEIEKELFVPPDINEQLDVKLSSDVDEQDLDADDEDSEEEDSFTHQGAEREFETEEELAAPYSLDDDEDNFDEDEEGMGNEERDYPRRRRVRTNIYTAKDFFNEEIHYRFDILDDDERKELEGTH
nr:hypothetical protein [Pseudomonadota bacterium]